MGYLAKYPYSVSIFVEPGIILDFDEQGRVVGIEMLELSTRISPEKMRVLQFETV